MFFIVFGTSVIMGMFTRYWNYYLLMNMENNEDLHMQWHLLDFPMMSFYFLQIVLGILLIGIIPIGIFKNQETIEDHEDDDYTPNT